MLIDIVLSSDYANGHWFEADWLLSKCDALSSNRKVDGSKLTGSTIMSDTSERCQLIMCVSGTYFSSISSCFQVALKHVIHDMVTSTLVMELRRCAIKRWVPCGDMDRRLKDPSLSQG